MQHTHIPFHGFWFFLSCRFLLYRAVAGSGQQACDDKQGPAGGWGGKAGNMWNVFFVNVSMRAAMPAGLPVPTGRDGP